MWGELESEEEEEEVEESEEEEGEDQETPIDPSGLVTPAEGLATPSGFSSVPAGLETPDMIELRKKKIEAEMERYTLCVSFQTYLVLIFCLFSVVTKLHSYILCCQRSEPTESVKR